MVPIPHAALVKIDRAAIHRNYLPTRVLGFAYAGWSKKNGVVRVEFRGKNGVTFEWRIETMTGNCDIGKQKSFQLAGNKIWYAQVGNEQRAWRCAFDQTGKEVRLEAASTAPPNKLAGVGLGTVAASAKKY